MDDPFVLNNYVYSDDEGEGGYDFALLALKEVELALSLFFLPMALKTGH